MVKYLLAQGGEGVAGFGRRPKLPAEKLNLCESVCERESEKLPAEKLHLCV